MRQHQASVTRSFGSNAHNLDPQWLALFDAARSCSTEDNKLVQYEQVALEWLRSVDPGSGYLVAFCKDPHDPRRCVPWNEHIFADIVKSAATYGVRMPDDIQLVSISGYISATARWTVRRSL